MPNSKVLQKCVEELSKPTPNIDKVIGILETVIEMGESQQTTYPSIPYYPNTQPAYPGMPNPVYSSTATNANIPIEEEGSGLLAAYAGGLPADIH